VSNDWYTVRKWLVGVRGQTPLPPEAPAQAPPQNDEPADEGEPLALPEDPRDMKALREADPATKGTEIPGLLWFPTVVTQ